MIDHEEKRIINSLIVNRDIAPPFFTSLLFLLFTISLGAQEHAEMDIHARYTKVVPNFTKVY